MTGNITPVMTSSSPHLRCLLATDPVTGDLLHDTCLAWHGALLVLVGILVSGPYALITSAISAELGTHKKLKGSKALATVSAIINGTGSVGRCYCAIRCLMSGK